MGTLLKQEDTGITLSTIPIHTLSVAGSELHVISSGKQQKGRQHLDAKPVSVHCTVNRVVGPVHIAA